MNDLLAEMAWRLDELAPGEEIGADTDVGNEPMARAFARAGFRNVAARMVMTERGMGSASSQTSPSSSATRSSVPP